MGQHGRVQKPLFRVLRVLLPLELGFCGARPGVEVTKMTFQRQLGGCEGGYSAPWQADCGGANLPVKPCVTGATGVLLQGCHQEDLCSAVYSGLLCSTVWYSGAL